MTGISDLNIVAVGPYSFAAMDSKEEKFEHEHDVVSQDKVELAILDDDVHTKKLTKKILWKLDTR